MVQPIHDVGNLCVHIPLGTPTGLPKMQSAMYARSLTTGRLSGMQLPIRRDWKASETQKETVEEKKTYYIEVGNDSDTTSIMMTDDTGEPKEICINTAKMDSTMMETDAFSTVEIPAFIECHSIGSFCAKVDIGTDGSVHPLWNYLVLFP